MPSTTETPDKKYDRHEAAEYIHVSYHTLEAWARDQRYLRFYKAGGKCVYRKRDLDAFIESRMVQVQD